LQPGVYCVAGSEGDPLIRLKGAALWAGPDAIFTGLAAAKLSFWESCRIDLISVGLGRRGPRSRNGVVVEQRGIAAQFTRRRFGMTMTSPALTAVDLAASQLGGEVIDRVLRMREATLADMWGAYRAHPYRPGNAVRAQLLHDSRDLPWSQADASGALCADFCLPTARHPGGDRLRVSLAGNSQRGCCPGAIGCADLNYLRPSDRIVRLLRWGRRGEPCNRKAAGRRTARPLSAWPRWAGSLL
jgi:hypothetical protein